eukprot:CAMPEP_0194255714 /NCGR_PEP_ID=MMETSP0158-20130606/35104_1 /TAXON_ID=33649 /ORGANISM="Thalassionema nitzschioides, Strain L26-B" /LENGTH=364 /DNA_ID=CAMNT_0038994163 /DNA_START=20 /DNA_END=1111 /DNA_ORIENTATION=+
MTNVSQQRDGERPLASDLHEAVLANSYPVVQWYLDQGADPNTSPYLAPISVITSASQEKYRDLHRVLGRVFRGRQDGQIQPLVVAACNAYHQAGSGREDAFKIIRALLRAGANVDATCNGVVFCKVGTHASITISVPKTAVKIALFLKRFPKKDMEEECYNTMDAVATLIIQHNNTKDKTKGKQAVPIQSNTISTWRRLLTSKDYSDLSFVCPDGKVEAHKCVLTAAAPYFRAALQGQWKEGCCENNEWKTIHSTRIIQGILTFIYTGELDEDRWHDSTSLIQLLAVASEYQLDALVSLCEDKLEHALQSPEACKAILSMAHLHSLTNLINRCYDYISENATILLVNSKFMSLAKDNTELWSDL